MTLLLSLSNSSYSILLGDRRLAQPDGKICEEEANKLCVLFCDDARVTFAFTGLAAFGNFRTQDWLRDNLFEIGESHHALSEILSAFHSRATRKFAELSKVIGKPAPIAFLISGFKYSNSTNNFCFLISNFHSTSQVPSSRKLEFHTLGNAGSSIVEAAGFTTALSERHRESLRTMLDANNPPIKVLRKAVAILRSVAKDKKSRGFIGAQCNSSLTLKKKDTNIAATYHSLRATFRAFGPDVVVAVTDCVTEVTGTYMQAGTFLSGPEIRKTDPCWCGSGRRFGVCHLKKFGSVYAHLPGFPKPLHWIVANWKKVPELSGRKYIVASSYE